MSARARAPLAALSDAWSALQTRRRRVLLTAVGVALAAAMLSAAVVIADGLGGGFDRAVHAADLGDVIVRFDRQPASRVARRIRALPDLAGFALRDEVTGVGVDYGRHHTDDAVAEVTLQGRRQGYAIVAGHGLSRGRREIVVEQAFATAWGIRLGATLYVRGLGPERVVGFAEGPDDVGYPLGAPRFYLTAASLRATFGEEIDPQADFAEIWLRDPRHLDEVLVQARETSFGLRDLAVATRGGVRVLIDQAAGIVIDLLVALSAIALATAAVMLAASARAEVQRRLRSIGIRRAVGATRGHVTITQALEVALVAAPAAAVGTVAGWLATDPAGDRLLGLLNQPGPGAALAAPLLLVWLVSVAIPVAGAAWPAWTASGRAVIAVLRGADIATPGRSRRTLRAGGGLAAVGLRLAAARPARLAATITMLACSTAFVLLLISLANTLSSLETDPQELGKHYQLTIALPPSEAGRVAHVAGVEAAEPRYQVTATDAYSLGQVVDVIAYPADHVRFEAPPLQSGRRLRGSHEAEVGVGLADALGLVPGSQLLLALPNGGELRLRVSGTVSALDDDGRVAFVPAKALLAADPSAPSTIAVLARPGADLSTVSHALSRLHARPQAAAGATARGAPLVAVLKRLLLAVAVVDGLVCLYALVQACALTIQERRRTVAVIRACGGAGGAVGRLLVGAVLALIVPAALIGIALERFLLGPALARIAADYATLDLRPSAPDLLITVAGLALAGAVAVAWSSRIAVRESVVAGLAG